MPGEAHGLGRSRSRDRSRRPRGVAAIGLFLIGTSLGFAAQGSLRKVATLQSLNTYAIYFHGESIAVRARARLDEGASWLYDGEDRLVWVGEASVAFDDQAVIEITGTFWDVGRLEQNDPRLAPYPIATLSDAMLGKPWPGTGELLILAARTARAVTPAVTPTVRAVALDPARYVDQEVTVSGRFRGRNLYGDLPQAPGQSLWDFVLQSADGAIWVTGQEPKGRDFSLDVSARVDTGRWLEVTGTVQYDRGLVWVEATRIEITTAPAATAVAVAAPERSQGPPPSVIFSAPVPGDLDVPPEASVRLQFSTDMDADTFRGRVRVSYLGGPPAGEDATTDFTYEYRDDNRVLEIRFTQPPAAYRTMEVELLEGIAAFDGARLEPWRLRFTLGS